LVTGYFAPFNVQVVTSRPASGLYEMSMIGGTPQLVGFPANAAGVALLDCGNQSQTDISFAFAEAGSNTPGSGAVVAAQEAAHGYGLGHVAEPTDIMYPQLDNQETGFHNQSMQIYDLTSTSSDCSGTGFQNDVTLLNANVGPSCSSGSGGSGGASGS